MNDVDDLVLLFRCHFVVGGEAKTAAEDVGTDINAGTGDVGIGATATVAFGGDEGVGAVDGLHMHRLPYRAAFGVEGGKSVEDL